MPLGNRGWELMVGWFNHQYRFHNNEKLFSIQKLKVTPRKFHVPLLSLRYSFRENVRHAIGTALQHVKMYNTSEFLPLALLLYLCAILNSIVIHNSCFWAILNSCNRGGQNEASWLVPILAYEQKSQQPMVGGRQEQNLTFLHVCTHTCTHREKHSASGKEAGRNGFCLILLS